MFCPCTGILKTFDDPRPISKKKNALEEVKHFNANLHCLKDFPLKSANATATEAPVSAVTKNLISAAYYYILQSSTANHCDSQLS